MAYAVMQRRKRADAARFGNPALLPGLATARPGWRRHLPPLLLLVALGALVVALARPQRTVAAPQRQATVMMVTDVSGSMRATDVEPDRLSAAVEAGHALADKLPDELRLGLVSFSDYAEQTVPPTTDRDPSRRRSTGSSPTAAPRWATRCGAASSRRGRRSPTATAAGRAGCPAVIVLLSDGKNTSGNTRPLDVARQAKALPHPDLRDRARHAERQDRADRPVLRHDPDDRGAARPQDAEGDRADHRRALLRDRKAADLKSIYANLGTRLSSSRRSARSPSPSPAAGSCCCCSAAGSASRGSAACHSDQLLAVGVAGQADGEHLADTAGVELRLEHVGLERARLERHQRVAVAAERDLHALAQ